MQFLKENEITELDNPNLIALHDTLHRHATLTNCKRWPIALGEIGVIVIKMTSQKHSVNCEATCPCQNVACVMWWQLLLNRNSNPQEWLDEWIVLMPLNDDFLFSYSSNFITFIHANHHKFIIIPLIHPSQNCSSSN